MENHSLDIMQRAATLTRRDQDKYSNWSGMARLAQK